MKDNDFPHLKSRILGYLAGDGSILTGKNIGRNVIKFFPDDESIIDSYKEAFLKVYDKEPKIFPLKNFYCLVVYSKPISRDLLNCGELSTSNWNIPNFVLNSNENKVEWLRAFFDCEGHVNNKSIDFKSVNKEGTFSIQQLMKSLGISSRIYIYEPKNPNWNTNYMLFINKKEDRLRYRNLIGFNHSTKLKKLNNSLD